MRKPYIDKRYIKDAMIFIGLGIALIGASIYGLTQLSVGYTMLFLFAVIFLGVMLITLGYAIGFTKSTPEYSYYL